MQGFNVHSRVTKRIHGLLDRQLMHLSEMLMSEDRYSNYSFLNNVVEHEIFKPLHECVNSRGLQNLPSFVPAFIDSHFVNFVFPSKNAISDCHL